MATELRSVRGMHDLFGEELRRWRHIEGRVRAVLASYGYEEITTPVLEKLEVFQAVGDDTDIVEKQMYVLQEKSHPDAAPEFLALRPEGTAGFARAVVEHKLAASGQATRFFYYLPMFRYERPQKGRLRQFHQFGAEFVNDGSPEADAEAIALLEDIFRQLGLDRAKGQYEVRINSVGDEQCRPQYRDALVAYFRPHFEKLCAQCQKRLEKNPLRILDCKNESCRALAEKAPRLVESLCTPCRTHHDAVKARLTEIGCPYVEDPSIVRGLDYYRRTAFEIVSPLLGAQSALAGGGRYDGLGERFGKGGAFAAVGWGLGMERLVLALEAAGVSTQWKLDAGPLVQLVPVGPETFSQLWRLLFDLRRRGLAAGLAFAPDKGPKWHLKQADRVGARFALLLGGDELARGVAAVKELATGKQHDVPLGDIFSWLENEAKK